MIFIKKLLIVGAGGHGRCCLDIAKSLSCYDEIAFLDDPMVHDCINGSKVIGKIDEMCSYYLEYEDIFIAIGNNEMRKKWCMQAEMIGYRIVTLISPKADVSPYAAVGKGTIVFPFAQIEANAWIGEGNIISAHTVIHHDAKVEAYGLLYANVIVRPAALIQEKCRIESHCVIQAGTRIPSNQHIPAGTII